MASKPGCPRKIEFQIAVFHGPVVSFANEVEQKHVGRISRCIS